MTGSAATSKVIEHRYKAAPRIKLTMTSEERKRWGIRTGSISMREIIRGSCNSAIEEREQKLAKLREAAGDLEPWEIQQSREDNGPWRGECQVGEPFADAN